MKGTMKRALAFALLLACLALCGCAAQPPRALVRAVPEGQRLVSADTFIQRLHRNQVGSRPGI